MHVRILRRHEQFPIVHFMTPTGNPLAQKEDVFTNVPTLRRGVSDLETMIAQPRPARGLAAKQERAYQGKSLLFGESVSAFPLAIIIGPILHSRRRYHCARQYCRNATEIRDMTVKLWNGGTNC